MVKEDNGIRRLVSSLLQCAASPSVCHFAVSYPSRDCFTRLLILSSFYCVVAFLLPTNFLLCAAAFCVVNSNDIVYWLSKFIVRSGIVLLRFMLLSFLMVAHCWLSLEGLKSRRYHP